ncbi:hypothetical protein SUGI_0137540 [Cryptomeria japonica]|nr:hypothetical protein SUGI_0137540 [Cryptomeria japonica]
MSLSTSFSSGTSRVRVHCAPPQTSSFRPRKRVALAYARIKRPVEERFNILCERNVSENQLEELCVERWSKWESGKCKLYWEWQVDQQATSCDIPSGSRPPCISRALTRSATVFWPTGTINSRIENISTNQLCWNFAFIYLAFSNCLVSATPAIPAEALPNNPRSPVNANGAFAGVVAAVGSGGGYSASFTVASPLLSAERFVCDAPLVVGCAGSPMVGASDPVLDLDAHAIAADA